MVVRSICCVVVGFYESISRQIGLTVTRFVPSAIIMEHNEHKERTNGQQQTEVLLLLSVETLYMFILFYVLCTFILFYCASILYFGNIPYQIMAVIRSC